MHSLLGYDTFCKHAALIYRSWEDVPHSILTHTKFKGFLFVHNSHLLNLIIKCGLALSLVGFSTFALPLLAMSRASLFLAMRKTSSEVRHNPAVVSKNPFRITTGCIPILFRSRISFASKMLSISSAFVMLSGCVDENSMETENTFDKIAG